MGLTFGIWGSFEDVFGSGGANFYAVHCTPKIFQEHYIRTGRRWKPVRITGCLFRAAIPQLREKINAHSASHEGVTRADP
jgi:hypothetical protein